MYSGVRERERGGGREEGEEEERWKRMRVRFRAGEMLCDLVCRDSMQPFLQGHGRACGRCVVAERCVSSFQKYVRDCYCCHTLCA